jgi:polyphosphate kinase 2 (PPK2 family)
MKFEEGVVRFLRELELSIALEQKNRAIKFKPEGDAEMKEISPADDSDRHSDNDINQSEENKLIKPEGDAEMKETCPANDRLEMLKSKLEILFEYEKRHLDLLKEYKEEIRQCQQRVFEIEHEIYTRRIPVVILYQGWDAAGKGGNIRRLTQAMDPRGYVVMPIGAPNDLEKAHHYLWRFWEKFPKAGHIAIFDRSWYERVLVERIEGFCSEAEWKRAYREINEFEEQLVNFGTVLVKLWLHIDPAEQLRRFQDRQQTPAKQWKITAEDWRNREKWEQHKEAVDEMLFRTSTAHAPWTIIEANSKYYARIKTLKTVIDAVASRL